jgi:GNAT superfamily N-acetyltransferase
VHFLENPVWHALTGRQADRAERVGDAVRYPLSIGPFAGIPDDPTAADWEALRILSGPGQVTTLFRHDVPRPATWTEEFCRPGVQMDGAAARGAIPTLPLLTLGRADVPDMLELVTVAPPGPFETNTVDLGGFLGIRFDGRLVAMAGLRMRLPGYQEISGVCTHPDFRGRGWAGQLIQTLVLNIQAAGDTPFLHTLQTNTGAIRLYESIGFSIRHTSEAVGLRAPA